MTVSILKTWGYEVPICNGPYAAKFLYVKADHHCSDHRHAKKDETFLILRGTINLNKRFLTVGETVSIPHGIWHSFAAVGGDAIILEVSTHDDSNDTERRTLSIDAPPANLGEFLRERWL